MALRVAQESHEVGKNTWKWSVWLVGPQDELDAVEAVRYVLHSTFRDPVRVVKDRESSFRLDSSGWGEFRVFAHVKTVDGEVNVLSTWLHLLDPERRRVFVSAQSSDADVTAVVARALQDQGIEVLSTTLGMTSSATSDGRLADSVLEADAVVTVFTSEPTSPWVAEDVSNAREAGIPIYSVVASSDVELPKYLADVAAVPADEPNDLDRLAMEIRGLEITPG